MSEAIEENPFAYASFHDFFIRRLKTNTRPIEDNASMIISPADGILSEYGRLQQDRILQAKGHDYFVNDLLAQDKTLTKIFEDGSHALIYLAPHNYHRVHMPITGRLKQMIYVPGTLYSVSPKTAQRITNLFAKNERLILIFDTDIGNVAVILVGAMIVGSISTVWAGKITPPRDKQEVTYFDYTTVDISLKKGEELGYFSLGSTVILLLEKNKIDWIEVLSCQAVQIGQNIAKIVH